MSEVNDWSTYDTEGTYDELVGELSHIHTRPGQRLRLHLEVIENDSTEEEEKPWLPSFYVGAFESDETDVSARAKEILREELGRNKI